MFTERFLSQVISAEHRFHENRAIRDERKDQLERLREGKEASLASIDSPSRIARRFTRLSQDPLTSEAIISRALRQTDILTGKNQGLVILERIIGQKDLLSADFLAAGMRASRAVGRVVIRDGVNNVMGYGTGFMVSPRLMMTNNHVLDSASLAGNSKIQFDYVETLSGTELQPQEFRFDPHSFFETDPRLDFTLVAVESTNGDGVSVSSRGWLPLIADSGKAIVFERVNILQHPGGDRQQLAIRQNKIVDLPGDFMHYTSDTERGSSGAPVLNDQWQIAALHHAGVPERNDDGEIMLQSGQPWDHSRDTIDQIQWKANEGARISKIVSVLENRAAGFSDEQYAMYKDAFVRPALEESENLSNGSHSPEFKDGRLSWSMPIEFSVDIPLLKEATASDRSGRPRSRPQGDHGQNVVDEFSRDGIDLAKTAFAAHKDETYYDADADEQANISYYADIKDSAVGEELFDALHELLRETHTTEFNYFEARYGHLYPWVDLRPNRGLASIYSGSAMDFDSLVESEALIETRHAIELQEFVLREGAFDEQTISGFRMDLEARDPFNCEHVVCQSWFDEKQPMKADLHHLVTCEPNCNSSRNNNAYFDFDPDVAGDPNCGQVDKSKSRFEPADGKGVVARATLYFLLRYPGKATGSLSNERIKYLLKWNNEYAVSEYEKHRNAEIEKVQGNRNPLIDYPSWAEFIPFEKALE